MTYLQNIREAKDFLIKAYNRPIDVAIVLGSGLGPFVNQLKNHSSSLTVIFLILKHPLFPVMPVSFTSVRLKTRPFSPCREEHIIMKAIRWLKSLCQSASFPPLRYQS